MVESLKKLIKKLLRLEKVQHPYYHMVDHEGFGAFYEKTEKETETRPSVWRRDRFFNLYQAIHTVRSLEGEIVECGVWKGLSALVICSAVRLWHSNFKGDGVTLIDSFEGLSEPTFLDGPHVMGEKGDFRESIDKVRGRLHSFPNVELVKGWIPNVLSSLPERKYRFVHLDLDLVEPTLGALRYFEPRMVKGGIIVCDDYGSIAWPGTKKEMDAFCSTHSLRTLYLSTSQLLILF